MLEKWRKDSERLRLKIWVCEVDREARNENGKDRQRLDQCLRWYARLIHVISRELCLISVNSHLTAASIASVSTSHMPWMRFCLREAIPML